MDSFVADGLKGSGVDLQLFKSHPMRGPVGSVFRNGGNYFKQIRCAPAHRFQGEECEGDFSRDGQIRLDLATRWCPCPQLDLGDIQQIWIVRQRKG